MKKKSRIFIYRTNRGIAYKIEDLKNYTGGSSNLITDILLKNACKSGIGINSQRFLLLFCGSIEICHFFPSR